MEKPEITGTMINLKPPLRLIPDLSMREISEQLGFYDESHFTKFFKKQNGVTPRKYRNSARVSY